MNEDVYNVFKANIDTEIALSGISPRLTPSPKAITSPDAIRPGTTLYYANGQDGYITALRIASKAMRFEEHREYTDIHASQRDEIVFDTEHEFSWNLNDEKTYYSMEFVASYNIGNHYNEHYLFETETDAKEFIESAKREIQNRPQLRAYWKEEQKRIDDFCQMVDDMCDDAF